MAQKNAALAFAILLILAFPIQAQVTKEDLREMESRLKEYVDVKIGAAQADIKEYVDGKVGAVQAGMKEDLREAESRLKEHIDIKTSAVQADIGATKWLVGALVVVVVAVMALPQVVAFVREQRNSREMVELRERLAAVEKKLEAGA